jgi:hypothetical protein
MSLLRKDCRIGAFVFLQILHFVLMETNYFVYIYHSSVSDSIVKRQSQGKAPFYACNSAMLCVLALNCDAKSPDSRNSQW